MNLRKPALLALATVSIGSLVLWLFHDPEPVCDGLKLRPDIRLHSLDALFAVSRNSTLELKCLNHLVAATDDNNLQVRKMAYQHLRHFTNYPNEVIPVFVKGLHDDRTLHTCFSIVKNFGSAAAPALVEAMKKESGHVRPAEALLEQIDPDLVQRVKASRPVGP